jgi:hypothetical protein
MAKSKMIMGDNPFKGDLGCTIYGSKTYKLPEYVRIVGKDFSVSEGDEHFKLSGEMDEAALSIVIKPGQLPVEEADTLLHEVIHAIDSCLCLNLSERQVRLTATCLLAVIQDNPEFSEFITRPLGRTNT